MPTITDNLNLFKPDPGQSGVAAELNGNWDQLDFRFDEAGGHTHDGTPGQGPKVPVTSLATTGTPSATTYLRGDGLWTTGTGGGGGVTDHGALTGLTDDDHPQYHNQSRGDARYAQKANNLSDLANTATARTNIGAAAASHQHAGADITTGTVPTARLGSGTPSTSTFLRGDQTWAVPGAGGMVNLDDLADVLITAPADNQVLTYDAAGGRWINETPATGGGGEPAPAEIITSGLIFALPMSEGTGQTIAAGHGTSYGAVLGSTSAVEANDPDWVPAGLDFVPGTSDVATATGVPDTGWLGTLTVMVVAKVDTGGAPRFLLGKHPAGGGAATPVAFTMSNAATPLLSVVRGNSDFSAWSGPAVTLGGYRCYSVVCPGTITLAPTFYVGTTATAGTNTANWASAGPATGSNAPVVLGRRPDGASQFDGVIGYVLVYNRALSAAEIATNYDALGAIMNARGVTLPGWVAPSAPSVVATDPIWDAAGDLAVGSGANTAAKLPIGTAGHVLTSTGTAAAWQAPASGAPDAVTTLTLVDDFLTGNSSSGHISTLGWSFGGSSAPIQPGTLHNPGIIELVTPASINGEGVLYLDRGPPAGHVLPAAMFDVTWIVKLSTGLADTTARVGLSASISASTQDAIYFEKLAADTSWFGVTRAANSQTRTAAVAAATTNFVKLRCRRVNGTTIGFSVDGGTEVTATATIPTLGISPLALVIATTAAAKRLQLDLFRLIITGLVR